VVTDAVRNHPGAPLTVVVERNGHHQALTVTPANGRVEHEHGVVAPSGTAPFGVIGVSFGEPVQRSSPLRAVVSTPENLWNLTWASAVGVGHLFSPNAISQRFNEVSNAKAADRAAADGTRTESIVGVVNTATQAAQAGIGQFLSILIVINVFFGVFNLFPMLPLDGGHVAIAIYEKIRTGRRRVAYHADAAKLLPFTWAMVTLLAIVVVPALLTDILHPMANPFG
jgi:membrane-associated protease RseP (regulator of RpoE activity)